MPYWYPNFNSPTNFMNVNLIHPLKQAAVGRMVASAPSTGVESLIIFGSTVDGRCTAESDIDVLYRGRIEGLGLDITQEWDMLDGAHVPGGERLWLNILQEGVLVYVAGPYSAFTE